MPVSIIVGSQHTHYIPHYPIAFILTFTMFADVAYVTVALIGGTHIRANALRTGVIAVS